MNKKLIIIIFCLFTILFSAISFSSASDLVDNETVSTSEDEIVEMPEQQEMLTDSPGSFDELEDLVYDSSATLELQKNYTYSAGDNSPIKIDKDITIDGNHHIIDGSNQASIFTIESGYHVILQNIIFKNANGTNGAALKVGYGSDVEIINCSFIGNAATGNGGAVYINSSNVILESLTFESNTAGNDGAALYVAGDYCNLANSTFTGNIAGDDGPAVYWEGNNGMIYNITCTNNKGTSNGSSTRGGTAILTGSNVTVRKSSFANSFAGFDGGALFITGNNDTIIDCDFDNCTARDEHGGALYIIGNNTNILDCNFNDCHANLSGGVIYVVGDDVIISNAVFTQNGANLDGGALFVNGTNCKLYNSTFSHNVAGDDGGAIYWEGSEGVIYNITCLDNKGISDIDPTDGTRSNSKGGTICLTGSNVTIDKSDFTQSSAKVDGGALFITGNNVNVYNSTFKDCTSTNSSGGALYIIGNNTNVLDCNFSDCNVDPNGDHRGGAIYVAGNNGTIAKSSFLNTKALIGGAIFIAGDDTTVDNSLFRHNDASGPLGGSGGAVYIEGAGGVVSNSDFAYGTTVNYGGAISIWGPNALITKNIFDNSSTSKYNGGTIFVNGANTTISLSNFTRSKSMGDQYSRGGAIDVQGDNTNILECNFYDCESHFGGVIYVSGMNAVIDKANVDKSKAYEGGAIYISGDNTNISLSNFTDIDADNYGGAIYLAGDDTNISQCNFEDCTVKLYHGGAIYIAGERTFIEDANFTSCKALSKVARGGAIDIQGEYTTVVNSNFNECSAVEGGCIFAYGNFARIEDCIFNLSNAQDGGAIYLVSWGALIKANVSDCNASLNGGAIYVAAGGPHITESNFEGCIAKGTAYGNGGGAIYVLGPDTHISESTFNDNRVVSNNARGGTIYITGERTFIENSDFNDSYAGQGGIIFIEGEEAIINASSFTNSLSKYSGGAISVSGHNATIEWSTFENISATSHGGAIYVDGEDTSILHSSFYNCSNGKYYGGAVYINDVGTTIAYSNFTLSKADTGGSIYISGENTTITYCNLDNNTAGMAGAIKVTGANTIISNSNLTNNVATSSSGGAIDLSGRNASVLYSYFDNNTALNYGGAINWEGGHGEDSIIGSTFTNNACYGGGLGGGAVYWTASKSGKIGAGGLIEDSIFINNTAYGHHGGAIDWFHAINSTINNCLFINNTASSDGGALYTGDKNGNSFNFTISNSQFYNNTAGKHGGAIANQMMNSLIFNNTFDGNKASSSGGTILMKEAGAKNSVVDHCYIYNSFCNIGDEWGESGGAIHIGPTDTNITISNCAIINSTCNQSYGGAISVRSPYSSLINVTIQNVATNDGYGGAICWSGNYGKMNNVTIFNSSSNAVTNARSADGGSIYLSGINCNLNDIKIASSSSNINSTSISKNGYGGAIYVGGSNNVITNLTIDDSNASSVKMNTRGGAIYWSGSSGTLMNASISNTLANGMGGAIYWAGGSPKIDNISIEYSQTRVINSTNSANGGAIYMDVNNELNNVRIVDAIASTTNGDIRGGAIYYNKGSALNNVTVNNSRAVTANGNSYGGAVYLVSYSNAPLLMISNSSFNENTANFGGAIYSNRAFHAENTSFVGNVALDGGAIYSKSGKSEFVNATFSLNSAIRGGAIFVDGTQLLIYDSHLKNNTAENKGGAIYYNYVSALRDNIIQNTDIVNNTAFSGSAIFATRFNKFTLTDVILLDNQANAHKFIDKVIGVDETGQNYTAGVFLGFDNLLNAMWSDNDLYNLICNNVTYWDANGTAIANSKPGKSNREAGQNVTIELFNGNGEKINETNVTTDHDGRFKYVFDAKDGETYFFAYTHKTDRYYTYIRETYSNSSLVKVYVYNPIFYNQNQTLLISLTDGAWGDISGNVTVRINDTKNTTFIVEVINGTATVENLSGFDLGDYNVTVSFKGDLNHTGDTDWAVFTVLPYDDLHITKDVNITGDFVNVTDIIRYTINVTNHGPSKAWGVNVTEILSPYLKLLDNTTNNHGFYNKTGGYWYIGDLDVDEIATLTIIAQVIHAGPITNTVWVTSEGNDTNLTNNIDSAHNFTALPIVDLAIAKEVNVTVVDIGVTDIIKFTIVVTNNGPCNATGVYVNETLSPCLEIISNTTTKGNYSKATWLIGELNSGENATLTIVARVVYAGIIENIVSVTSHENDTNLTNNVDNITALNATAHVDLAINKTVNVTGKVNVTDLIEFTISVTNKGPCNAVGVFVSEILDSHLKLISNSTTIGKYADATWIIGNLGVGEVHNLTIVAQVISAGEIANTVTVAGYDNDTNMSNNNASIDNITALPIVDLMINKTVNVQSNIVNVTDRLIFTITVKNNGPCTATGVNVTEVLDPHLELISASAWSGTYNKTAGVWDIGDLEANVTTVLVIEARVAKAGTIANAVVVTSNENDTNKSNNKDEIDNITALPIVDLAITKSIEGDVSLVNVSDKVRFTIIVMNNGPCDASDVKVSEVLSPYLKILSNTTTKGKYNGTVWYIGNLSNHTGAVLTIEAEVIGNGSVENRVVVTSHENDTNPFNNHDEVYFTSQPIVDLGIIKKVNVTGKVNVTDLIEFNITVYNNGPCNATDVYVGEILNPHLTLISNTTTIGEYDGATWKIGKLNVGEVHNLTIVARVKSVGTISNYVFIKGYQIDTNSSNNNDTIDNITALPIVDLNITKTVDVQSGFVNVSDYVTFTIRVQNKGPCVATNVNVTEVLSPHLKMESNTTWMGYYNVTDGVWYIGDLDVNVPVELVLRCQVISAGVISNVVVVNSTENDTNRSNNENNITNITALPIVDLQITKDVNVTGTTVNVTNKIKFTVTVKNNGPCNATNVNVSEEISQYLKLLTNHTDVGSYDGHIWYIGNLTNGSSVVLTIEAEVIGNGSVENKVVVNCYENDTNPFNNHDEVYLNAVRIVDLVIDKKVNVNSTDVDVMDIIEFNITVRNDGPCNATEVYVSEPLSPCLEIIRNVTSVGTYDGFTWHIGDLNVGANATLTIVARVAYVGIIENEVEVFSSQLDTNITNNKDNITPLNATAHVDLAINKTVNVTGKVNVTDLIEFNITVRNNGPCNASGVYVSEIIDSHLEIISNTTTKGKYVDGTWIIGLLDAGENHNLTIVARVIKSGNITNAVTVYGYGNDSNSSNNNASIDNLTALDIVDLKINKTADVQSNVVNVTDKIVFTITVKNNGPCVATGVKVTEVLDSHLKFISASAWSGNYSNSTGIWDIGDLGVNVTTVLVIETRVDKAGIIANVVVVTSNENDTNMSNNKYNITNITALPIVDLMINKTVNVTTSTVNVTDKIKFTITVTNNGPCNATDVYVNEELSPYLKLLTNHTDNGTYDGRVWYIGNLTNGSSVVLTIEAQVRGNGSVENKVVVNCYENDTNPFNNHDEVYLNAVRIVDLVIDKEVNVNSTAVEVMDEIKFTITVRNDGPCNATGVFVWEPISPRLEMIRFENSTGTYDGFTWYIGDMNNGTTETLVIFARVIYSGIIENEVEVFSSQIDTNITNNKDNITPLNASAHVDLAINKTVNVTGKVNVTEFINFTITVTNNGPCNASGVFVSEILDSNILRFVSYNATNGTYDNVTWNIGNLKVGEIQKLTIIAQVISVGNITNVVSIKGYDDDRNLSNNNATIKNITALPIVDLQITKEVNVTGKVNVSDKIRFTITVKNNGPWDATDVNVTEVLSSCLNLTYKHATVGDYNGVSWYIGNLANQSSAVLTIIAQVVKSGNITNVVLVKSHENDTNTSNNNDSIDNITALPIVDIKVTKTANSLEVNVTENVTYTITVVNLGPCNATDVTVAEKLSSLVRFIKADPEVGYYNKSNNVWYIGNLSVNTPVVLTIVCKVLANGTIENAVVADCHENDTNLNNNHDAINVTSDFVVDLGVSKTVNVTGTVNVGDYVEFNITVYNIGPCNATNVYVGELLNPNLIFVSSNATKGRYDGLTWRIGNLTAGEVHNLTIVAQVISPGIISNLVVVNGKEFDRNMSNNNDTIDNFTALPVVDLEITKSVNVDNGIVNFGDEIVFSIDVRNAGPCDATNVNVSEVLSPHLKLESYDATLGDYNVTRGVWYIGDLGKQNSAELVLYCRVISVGVISNVVVVNSTENDTDYKNNRYNITNITALPIVDLEITKVVNITPGIVNVTDKIKYTITVKNNGPCNATNVNVTEQLSSSLKLLSNHTDNGTYDGYIWYIGNLTNGSSVVLTIEAEVIHEGFIENVVVVDCYENDTDYDNNMASVDLTALAIIDLIVNKEVNVTSRDISVTELVKFTVTVYNDGPCNATGVFVSEGLSPCLEMISANASIGSYDGFTWTIDNLNNGTTATLTIVARVIYSGIIENEVVAYSYENDTNLTNNRDNITSINASTYADLAINKTVNVTGTVNVTDKIEFVITVWNNGPCNATGVVVSEILDSHLKLLSNTTSKGKYDASTWVIGTLSKGEVVNLTIVAEVISAGNITNVVSVNGFENDTNSSNNNASIDNITAYYIVDLAVNKTVNVTGSVNVTDKIEFVITVWNNGPCNATGVIVGEILNSNLKLLSNVTSKGKYDGATWVIGSLSKGEVVNMTIVAEVISAGNITNVVSVDGFENDTNSSNNNASIDNITSFPIVDLAINKTVNVTGCVNVSDKIKFVITVWNNGPCNASGVIVGEILNSNLKLLSNVTSKGKYDGATWVIGSLNKGEVVNLTIVAEVVSAGNITNAVSVDGFENDTNSSNNNASIDNITALPIVDLKITKTVNVTGSVNVTDLIEFNITVKNNGPCNATGVYVSEIINSPLKIISNMTRTGRYDGFTWTIGNLTNGSTAVLTIIAQVISTGNITNAVNVTSIENDTNKSNDKANITNITALPIVDLVINKTVNASVVNVTDLIKYVITVHNNGPCNATGVNVSEVLSSDVELIGNETRFGYYDGSLWHVGKLENNQTATLTLIVRVIGNGTVTNAVNVTSNENDTNRSNNNYTSDNVTALPIVDVKINKTVNVTDAAIGDIVKYTISVVNCGPSNATDVCVCDKLELKVKFVSFDSSRSGITYNNVTGEAFIGRLNVNESVVLTIVARVVSVGNIVNVANVTSRENDTNKSNNNATSDNITSVTVNLIVNKTVNASVVNVSDYIRYTITVKNNGPSDATGLNVSEIISPLLELVKSETVYGRYDNASNVWYIGNLTNQTTAVLDLTFKVIANGTITNTVITCLNENDTIRTDSPNSTALPIVDVSVIKTVDVVSVRYGESFTYTIIVHNNGPNDASNVNVTEKLSKLLALIDADASKGRFDADNGCWYVGTLKNNETATLTLNVEAIGVGVIENVVSLNATENDTNITNNNYACDNVTSLSLDTPIDLDCYDITYGDDETITVTLPGNATGTVNITVGERHYDDVIIDHGVVILPVYDLAGGKYDVEVVYGGDGIYTPNSTSGKFTVHRDVPIITIEVEDIWVGEIEVLNVTVTAPGSVNVTVNGITVNIPLDNGEVTTDVLAAVRNSYLGNATWNIQGLPVGAYPAFALYLGNENYTSVNTSDLFHVRDKASTVVVSAKDIYVGEDAIINIKVGPKGVSGNVTVTLEGKTYVVEIDKDGKAQLIVSNLKAGLKDVKVEYEGTVMYRPSENSTTFKVLKQKPPINIDTPENTGGKNDEITILVPDDATGTITIEVEGKRYTSKVKDGKATFVVPGLKVGVHEIKVYYSGDDKYSPVNKTVKIKVNPKDEPPIEKNKTFREKVGLEVHETGNPIFMLLLMVLAIGSTQIRRFEK